jgi:hypothetical protein
MNWRNIARKPFNLIGIETPGDDLDLLRSKLKGKPYWWSNFPLILNFDPCNYCGQKYSKIGPCEWCFPQNEIIRGRMNYQEMPMEQIKWILHNIDKYGTEMREATKRGWGGGSWDPFYDGDPLANPRLPEILRLGKQIAQGINTEIFTCGSLTENAWMICDNVDVLHVTLSAHNSELYQKVHRGNMFNQVLETMRYITEHRKPSQKLIVNHVTTKTNLPYLKQWHDLMKQEFPEWKRAIVPLITSPDNVYAQEALGDLTLCDQEQAIRAVDSTAAVVSHETASLRQPCQLWGNMTILVDGTIMECCNWYDPKRHNYGNIKDYITNGYDLHDAWMMRLANKHNNVICQSCFMRRPDAKQKLDKMKIKANISF